MALTFAVLVQAVLSILSDEILCVNTELRVIYDAYSTRQQGMPWGWDRPQHSAALTSAQLWQLMRDCHVPEPDCGLTLINPALAQVPAQHRSHSLQPWLSGMRHLEQTHGQRVYEAHAQCGCSCMSSLASQTRHNDDSGLHCPCSLCAVVVCALNHPNSRKCSC